jgi:hypothetical protein
MRRCRHGRRVMADALAQDDASPADAHLADAALLASMQCRLVQRLAARSPAIPAIRWGALTACALAGLYLGTADLDAEQPDLLAAVQVIAIDAAL